MPENFGYWIDKYKTEEDFMNSMYQNSVELDEEDVQFTPDDLSSEDYAELCYIVESYIPMRKVQLKELYPKDEATRNERINYLRDLADKCDAISKNVI